MPSLYIRFATYRTVRAVNNVGKSHTYPVYLAECDPSELSDIIAVNVGATVRITRMVLPGMVKRCALILITQLPPLIWSQEKRTGTEYGLIQRDRPVPYARHVFRFQSVH